MVAREVATCGGAGARISKLVKRRIHGVPRAIGALTWTGQAGSLRAPEPPAGGPSGRAARRSAMPLLCMVARVTPTRRGRAPKHAGPSQLRRGIPLGLSWRPGALSGAFDALLLKPVMQSILDLGRGNADLYGLDGVEGEGEHAAK